MWRSCCGAPRRFGDVAGRGGKSEFCGVVGAGTRSWRLALQAEQTHWSLLACSGRGG